MAGSTVDPHILAVDIGTSSVRVLAFDPRGRISARRQTQYGTIRPKPYYEEQDPDFVRDSVYSTIREALSSGSIKPESVAGICFSSQMYGVFPVDRHGRALGNNILWSDGRAEEQAERWKRELGPQGFYSITGCPLNSIFPVAKLAWMRQYQPETFETAARFVSIKDFVTAPLIGEWACDYSMASSTGLFDIHAHAWCPEALEAAGVSPDRLPRPVSGMYRFTLSPGSPLSGLGLPDRLPVFLGGGDGPLANLGSGASGVGDVNIDLGTSGAARAISDRPVIDPEASLWCFCLTDFLWASGGIVTNVGNAFNWLGVGLLGSAGLPEKEAYDLLNQLASEAGPGAEGLLVAPYLRKVRSPYWDGRLKGTVYGLTPDHGAGHIARALLEAVAFDIRTILALMESRLKVNPRVVLTGGLARSPILPQLLADVLEREIRIPEDSEGSVAGAALIGLAGLDLIEPFRFQTDTRRYDSVFPDSTASGFYRGVYQRYLALIRVLREIDLSPQKEYSS